MGIPKGSDHTVLSILAEFKRQPFQTIDQLVARVGKSRATVYGWIREMERLGLAAPAGRLPRPPGRRGRKEVVWRLDLQAPSARELQVGRITTE